MILIQFGQYIKEMMAVAVKNFQNFLWPRFLIIRQNVNMATNAILNCGLTPIVHSTNHPKGEMGFAQQCPIMGWNHPISASCVFRP